MPRPPAVRRVSKDLKGFTFKPQAVPMDRLERTTLPLDGLEALRLTDLEGLYQEEAAERMGVSRATFARALTAARHALAEALVHGKALVVGGGTVVRCRRRRFPCAVHGGEERRGRSCSCPHGA